ncbi:MAG: serine hydrolase domain-containing protein [Pseudomonadota bacterium]
MNRLITPLLALVALTGAASAQEDSVETAEPMVPEVAVDAVDVSDPVVSESMTDPFAADLETFIDGLMASYQATYHVPGYGLTVVDSDGPLFSKGYGFADVDAGIPVTPDGTRFHVASVSKTFVWVAVMMLADRGLVDLDADVNGYLTRFQMPEGERPMTLNDVMAHKVGLEDNFDLFSTKIDEVSLVDAMLASQPRQIFARGDVVAYSNWATNLAAVVVADVSGMSYAEFLFTEILEPLGMNGTALGTIGEAFVSIPASKNYGVTPFGPEEEGQLEQKNFAPIGGMTITPDDMGKWMRFLLGRGELDGVRLLSEETFAMMRERVFEGDPRGPDMVHGFSDRPFRSITLYGHDGSINSVYSTMVIAPDLDLAVFLTQNSHATYVPMSQLPHLVMDRVLTARGFSGTEVAEGTPLGEDAVLAAEEIAGRYISSRRPTSGFAKLFGGLAQRTVSAEDGKLSVNENSSPFLPIGPDLWESASGTRMSVLRHDDGTIKGLNIGFGAALLMPMTPAANVNILFVTAGVTALFLVSTCLGVWRRLGSGHATSSVLGRGLSLLALGSLVPIALLGATIAGLVDSFSTPFGELFIDFPSREIVQFSMACSLVSVMAAALLLSVPLAWTSSGWSVWRKLHHSALGLSYAALGVGLVYWGVAFNELVIG